RSFRRPIGAQAEALTNQRDNGPTYWNLKAGASGHLSSLLLDSYRYTFPLNIHSKSLRKKLCTVDSFYASSPRAQPKDRWPKAQASAEKYIGALKCMLPEMRLNSRVDNQMLGNILWTGTTMDRITRVKSEFEFASDGMNSRSRLRNSLQWTACSPKESNQTLRQTGQGSSTGNRGIISRRVPNIVEPEIRTIEEVVPMANCTMEELLQAPTEGDIPNDAIKLMLFPYSLEDAARIWYEKEPPNSILTWDDLVNKFVNQFFPPSKTTHLKNEISRFTQRFEETFGEAWDRFKEMLRACPHHGFLELTQIDTFYNGLNEQNQDSLNSAVGVNTNSREIVSKTDDRIDKLTNQISNLVEIVNKQVLTPVSAKAAEKTCMTCGGAHAYYDCIATDSNQPSVCAATGSYNQVKLIEDVGEDDDFSRGPWVTTVDYANVKGGITTGCLGDVKTFCQNGKLSKFVAVIKSFMPNALGDLTVILKDALGSISGTIYYKVLTKGDFGKAITIGVILIL
nr:reverse transcriptase domain-containing protein [Tanacetum cinerariifolium]